MSSETFDYKLISQQLVSHWDNECRQEKLRVIELSWREIYSCHTFPTRKSQEEALQVLARYGPEELLQVTRDEFFYIPKVLNRLS